MSRGLAGLAGLLGLGGGMVGEHYRNKYSPLKGGMPDTDFNYFNKAVGLPPGPMEQAQAQLSNNLTSTQQQLQEAKTIPGMFSNLNQEHPWAMPAIGAGALGLGGLGYLLGKQRNNEEEKQASMKTPSAHFPALHNNAKTGNVVKTTTKTHSNNAFAKGFVKSALAAGLSAEEVEIIFKEADKKDKKDGSSYLGRYLAMKQVPTTTMLENPLKTIGAGAAVSAPFGVAGGVMGGPIGAALGLHAGNAVGDLAGLRESAQARAAGGKGPKNKEKAYKENDKKLDDRGYAKNTLLNAGRFGLGGAALGGLLGAGMGGFTEQGSNGIIPQFSSNFNGGEALAGAIGGATSGGLVGGIGGGLSGLLTKAIHNNTSDETRDRAGKMKAKHPVLTALPFGDIVGAAKA